MMNYDRSKIVRSFTVAQAEDIAEVIERFIPMGDVQRASFILYLSNPKPGKEYRIAGNLGFGGKFHANGNGVYVDYYPEDKTPERDAIVERITEALNELGFGKAYS